MGMVLRIAGVVSRIGYALSRYRFLSLPLDILAMVGSLAVIPWQIWDGWTRGYAVRQVLVVGLCASLFVSLLVLRLRRYVVFRDESFSIPNGVLELCPEEKVEIRVTGFLEVHGKRHYCVEVQAVFQTSELREHIIMAKLRTRRSMGAVQSVADEWGWWYAFISPRKVQSIEGTRLYYGFGRRPAVRVVYTMENGKSNTLYLSFDDMEACALIAQEICSRSGLRGGGV